MSLTRATSADVVHYAWRVSVFVVLELGYIALAVTCLMMQVVLPSSFEARQTQVKGAATIVTTIWQTLAILPILNILANIFSSEWHRLYHKTGRLEPGSTDRVSTMTSGIWDQLKHATYSRSASVAFRAGLAASFMAIILHDLAPGAFAISAINIPVPTSTPIGSLSVDQSNSDYASTLMDATLQIEQLQSSVLGYTMQPKNCIVGWPDISYQENGTTLSYLSDSACWSHQCGWYEPTYIPIDPSANASDVVEGYWNTSTSEQWEVALAPTTQNATAGNGIFYTQLLCG